MPHKKVSPIYDLYGETGNQAFIDGLHMESIKDRSQLYDWEIANHRHEDFLQILYIFNGDGRIHIGHNDDLIDSPSLIIVPRLVPHGFHFDKNIEGCVITINHHFLQKLITFDHALFESLQSPAVLNFKKNSAQWLEIKLIIEQLYDEFTRSDSWRSQLIANHLIRLVIYIGRSLPLQLVQASKGSRAAAHVDRFKKFLDENFREHLSMGEYADMLGITKTQLNRVCREVLGKSSLELVHRRLIVEAQRDLVYSNISIKEIAFTLGFQDEAYFTRFFKKIEGISPSQFRSDSTQYIKNGS